MAVQTIDARTARFIGLVNEAYPTELEGRVAALAPESVDLPPRAMRLTKPLVDAVIDADRLAARHVDRIAVTAPMRSGAVLAHTAKS